MKKIIAGCFLVAIILSSPKAYSQVDLEKVAQTGLQFLKVDMHARSAGMASAYSMVGNDVSAIFSNPAGMALIDSRVDAFGSRVSWIGDISYTAAAAAVNLDNWGVFALSFRTSDYGQIIGTQVSDTDEGFVETGNVDVGSQAVGFAYSRSLSSQFMIGGQIKYAAQWLGESRLNSGRVVDNKVSGIAYDFGTIYYPGLLPSLRIGMSIRNFSQEFQYQEESFELPLTFKLAMAFDVMDLFGGSNVHSMLFAVDAMHPRDYTERVHVGGEYWYNNIIALRAGYKTNYDIEGLTAGFGLQYDLAGMNFEFDYAYSAMSRFSNVNRITLGFGF